MEIRDFSIDDLDAVLRLFRASFGKGLKEDFWKWKYLENPYGEPIIKLMHDGHELIGHYAVIPQTVQLGENRIKSAFSMTTMTHPDYSGRGVFTTLAQAAYATCREKDIVLVYGFPNQNSYYGFTNKLGWKGLGQMYGWELSAREAETKSDTRLLTEKVESFMPEHDLLWESYIQEGRVVVPRNAVFLNWRYFKKPGNEYEVLEFRDDAGGLNGYVVLKVFEDHKDRIGHIVDMVTRDSHEIRIHAIGQALEYFHRKGIKEVTCWSTDERYVPVLGAFGFNKVPWPTYFGNKALNGNKEDIIILEEFDNWLLTMGDSDVF